MTKLKVATEIDRNNRRQHQYYAKTSWLFGGSAGAWMLFLTIIGYCKGYDLLMAVSAHSLSLFLVSLCFFHHRQSLIFLDKIHNDYQDVAEEAAADQKAT